MRAGSRSPVSAPMSQTGWNTSSTIQAVGHVKPGTSTTGNDFDSLSADFNSEFA